MARQKKEATAQQYPDLLIHTPNSDSTERVNIDEDARVISLESIKEIFGVLPQLRQLVETRSLSVGGRNLLLTVLRQEGERISKALGHDEDRKQEEDLTRLRIRQANDEIRRLKAELGQKESAEGIANKLSQLRNTIYNWWQNRGFTYAEIFIRESFLFPKFSVGVERHPSTFTTTPVTDKEELNKKRAELDKVLDIIEVSGEPHVLDSQRNREWLIALFNQRFPGCQVINIDSNSIYGSPDEFALRHIEVRVPFTSVGEFEPHDKYDKKG